MTAQPSRDGEFPPAARQAVYDAIALRRDIRNFRPDPVPDEVLLRMLQAAHRAGSVGFMQPWDFVVVRAPERKAEVYELFRRATYAALKLQGILDAPLSVCVTCDTCRGGPHVLGRDTIRETDVYSTCLAVQNFWLAARAVGVGWVSIVDNAELAAALHLPAGVIPVAFLWVVDVGVDHDFGAATGLVHRKVARGTRNLAREPAMTREQAVRALLDGASVVAGLGECDVVALGEVGIGNTTAAAAVLALLTDAPADEVVGVGTGVGSATRQRKVEAVENARRRCAGSELDAVGVMAEVGAWRSRRSPVRCSARPGGASRCCWTASSPGWRRSRPRTSVRR
jgi:5,6-dimethylbenzimidazole synthase